MKHAWRDESIEECDLPDADVASCENCGILFNGDNEAEECPVDESFTDK